jgi:hypothetical protein
VGPSEVAGLGEEAGDVVGVGEVEELGVAAADLLGVQAAGVSSSRVRVRPEMRAEAGPATARVPGRGGGPAGERRLEAAGGVLALERGAVRVKLAEDAVLGVVLGRTCSG